MKYLIFILIAIVVYLGIQKQIDDRKIDSLQNQLVISRSENISLKKEKEIYNERQVQANSKIAELRKQVQANKENQSDNYSCYNTPIPDEFLRFLHHK